MLKRIEEFARFAEITGFRSVKIGDIEGFLDTIAGEKPLGIEVQFFDARFIATWMHLYFAALNALTAFKNEENVSKSLAMEALLYSAARRQITAATKLVGITAASSSVAVLIIGEDPRTIEAAFSVVSKRMGGHHDERVLELTAEKMTIVQKAFDISEAELEAVVKRDNLEKALTDLVVERMALLATQR